MKTFQMLQLLFLFLFNVVPSHQTIDQRHALHLLRKVGRSTRVKNTEWLSESTAIRSDREYLMGSQEGMQEADLIKALPGQPSNVTFAQYSGYVTVDSSSGRALFYYFTEAIQNPSNKPLILWLNGGPGCSSVGAGAMTEIGPFRVSSDGKTLYNNYFSWNRVANILFLESPAGVGFSYSKTIADYDKSGDKRTAEDSYTFLVNWFERFPQYKSRDFFIIGESYAGNYIPELTQKILSHKNGSQASSINLKGIMVGNGVMNTVTDSRGSIDFLWTHALISDQSYEGILKYCNFSVETQVQSTHCMNFLENGSEELGNIDGYNIYAPVCSATSEKKEKSEISLVHGASNERAEYDPCFNDYVKIYMNAPEVQAALHANLTNLPIPWDLCSSQVSEAWNDQASSMLPVYLQIIGSGVKILIYSGDVDTVVPVTSTRYSINELKLPIATSWYPWMNGDEVGGYSVIYKGLTFATVRGAGHEVPIFQPHRAFTMLTYFLAGKPLPKSSDA
eukprot:Gb_09232 [translate_table: standard]